MTTWVVVTVPQSQTAIKRERSDPATYGLNEQHQRVSQQWRAAPMQIAVTPDHPCSGAFIAGCRYGINRIGGQAIIRRVR